MTPDTTQSCSVCNGVGAGNCPWHRAPETAIPAWRSGYDTSEEAQAAYFGNMKPGEEGAGPTALSDEELGRIAHEAFDDYWEEDCKGLETEAWADVARAVLAAAERLREPDAAVESLKEAAVGVLMGVIPDGPGLSRISNARLKSLGNALRDCGSPLFRPVPGGQQR